MKISTALHTVFDVEQPILTGEESYEILGDMLDHDIVVTICRDLRGLTRYWSCIDKAIRAYIALKFSKRHNFNVVIGSAIFASSDGSSLYGHCWRPPFELHAWLQGNFGILDLALPGLIERGMQFRDEVGVLLVGRSPIILNGKPEPWMRYKAVDVLFPNEEFNMTDRIVCPIRPRCSCYTPVRCTRPATFWLIHPDGTRNPGGYVCELHGMEIINEYSLKINEKWSLEPIFTE